MLTSMLPSVAEAEAAAGSQGSRAVRRQALATLERLVEACHAHGDALAFFVPGLTTGLGRALLRAGAVATTTRTHTAVVATVLL